MAKGEDWSEAEIAATVADYMRMLTFELSGQRYSKTTHRRALLQLLQGRSDAAVELKHQNISAVLRDLGCIWISGYKPRGNYQRALADGVEDWINAHQAFDQAARAAVEQPAFVPTAVDFARLLVDAPRSTASLSEPAAPYALPTRSVSQRDYVAREARNSALGSAGELLCLEYETFRLEAAGQKRLAGRVEHVSHTRGDGLGYDILSFEENGRERFIEVKTTAFARETPFYASRNELAFSRECGAQFHLYRLFDFRDRPRLFDLPGPIDHHCQLDPVSYICQFS